MTDTVLRDALQLIAGQNRDDGAAWMRGVARAALDAQAPVATDARTEEMAVSLERLRTMIREACTGGVHYTGRIYVTSFDAEVLKFAIEEVRGGAAPQGWIVADAAGNRFRYWGQIGPGWTEDKERALRFARRQDAEAFAAEDEDAWQILPIPNPTEGSVQPQAQVDRSAGPDSQETRAPLAPATSSRKS